MLPPSFDAARAAIPRPLRPPPPCSEKKKREGEETYEFQAEVTA